ncbi:hypothetical protein L9F63_013914 [Diploptera punctata]|uniref:Uncharacterized protein n=1 Tax=Diploptera punctata TaxID=6984 RepID=A0AAD8AAL8_DIPPU|nr:hypothetical protein L9F63_013914 [Diploptera punctata]
MIIIHRTITVFAVVILSQDLSSFDLLNLGERSLVELLEHIARNYFILGRSILVCYPDKSLEYIQSPLKSLLPKSEQIYYIDVAKETLMTLNELGWTTQTTETFRKTFPLHSDFEIDSDKHYNYIVFVSALEEEDIETIVDSVDNMVDDTVQLFAYNARGRWVIVIVDQQVKSRSEIVMGISRKIYKDYYIYDSLIIIPHIKSNIDNDDYYEYIKGEDNETKDTFLLYTWLPFHTDGQRSILLDDWALGTESSSKIQRTNLFPKKIPPKINTTQLELTPVQNYPILIKTGNYTDDKGLIHYEYDGPEIRVMEIIAKNLNLPIRYVESPSEEYTYISRITDVIYFISLRGSDIGIGSLPIHSGAIGFAEFTDPYYITGDTWYVPCPKPYPRLKKISETFPLSVWLLFAVVVVLTSLVTWCRSKWNKGLEVANYYSGVMCFYCMWAVILGVSVPNMPRTSSVRWLFLLFVWYAFIMNMLFQTFFTSYLVDPGIIDQVHTIDGLLESGIQMGYYKGADAYYFADESDPISKIIKSRSEDCSDKNYKKCLLKVIVDKNYSSLRSELYADHFVKTTMPSRKKPLCSLDNRFISYYIGLYIKKNLPFLEPINTCLSYLTAGGIVEKIFSEFKYSWKYQVSPDAELYDHEEDEYFVFNVSHLIIGFYILASGFTVSFIAFICEIIHKFLYSKVLKILHKTHS